MRGQGALGRLQVLRRILGDPRITVNNTNSVYVPIRFSSDATKVTIGNITKELKTPRNPELVPVGYLSAENSQSWLTHLRWLLQKDQLGQDVFLIGPPGPLRRSLAMSYLQLTQR
ncbi:unnamed protein product, partial [Meganyctiphanes norvegica]